MIEVLLFVITLLVASGFAVVTVMAAGIRLRTSDGDRCSARDGRTDGDVPRALASDRGRERATHAVGMAMAEGRAHDR